MKKMGTEDGAKGHTKAGKGGGSKAAVNAVKAAVGKGVSAVKSHASRKLPPKASSDDSFQDAGGKPAKFVPTLLAGCNAFLLIPRLRALATPCDSVHPHSPKSRRRHAFCILPETPNPTPSSRK